MVICGGGNAMAVGEEPLMDVVWYPEIPKLDSVRNNFFSGGVGSLGF